MKLLKNLAILVSMLSFISRVIEDDK